MAERHKAVICSDREQNENNDDADNDPAGRHTTPGETTNEANLARVSQKWIPVLQSERAQHGKPPKRTRAATCRDMGIPWSGTERV